jgi:molybdopterin-binding protein
MNTLRGTIISIKHEDSLMLVCIDIKGQIFSSLILANDNDKWIEVGSNVDVLFKETEVMIATKESLVSARNSFVSIIKDIENGKLLSSVTFDFNGSEINAIVTIDSINDLKCNIGNDFRWFVKTNEVIIKI